MVSGAATLRCSLALVVQELEFHCLCSLLSFDFDSRENHDLAVLGTRNGTLDQQQLALGVDACDFEVLGRDGDVAHVTGHALARENTTRILRHTDRTRHIVRTRITVGMHGPMRSCSA